MSQMWMNANDPTKLMQPNMQEEEEVDDDEMGVAETYADYMPTKRTIECNSSQFFSLLHYSVNFMRIIYSQARTEAS